MKLNIEALQNWELNKTDRPIIISGPCSAESEDQVMKTALKLKEIGVEIFRAGIWKPRTRPNSFEGLGKTALPWLKSVKTETSMKVAVEVANATHVYEALKYGIDILWIGARTTANPFAVQEISETLEGIDTPVMIKNPINPDLELWIGAIERINKAGINRIAAIHRGFSHFARTEFRNDPIWQIPIDLKRRIPEIPIICDPSHICGKRDNIFEVSQKAMDLNYDGLIIESHIDPQSALSDGNQQITPERLEEIITKLILRNFNGIHNEDHILENLRTQIDHIDDSLIRIIGQRMAVSNAIGEYKKNNDITILQPKRWEEVIQGCVVKGEKYGMSSEFTEKLFKAIHQESINHQIKVMNK